MLRRLALAITDVSEERIVSIIKVARIDELGTALATDARYEQIRFLVTANVIRSSLILVIQMMGAIRSSETSVLTKATRRIVTEDGILHGHRRENLKSYIALTGWTL
jgi:hypothetical protein